jgi:hypothetical protein
VLDDDEFREMPLNATTRAQAVSALEALQQKFANKKPPA